jgi:hypothetical protein
MIVIYENISSFLVLSKIFSESELKYFNRNLFVFSFIIFKIMIFNQIFFNLLFKNIQNKFILLILHFRIDLKIFTKFENLKNLYFIFIYL